jgi:tetratricopeptide (TPR) repeat protein
MKNRIFELMYLENRIREKDDLNESVMEAFGRLKSDAFKTLVTKLVNSMGLEIINSNFEDKMAKIEANISSQIHKANYPSYLIRIERKTNYVTPEEMQDFVSERSTNEKGMIYISTSGFSDDARLYAKEFDVEIADDRAFMQLLRKFDLLDDVMIYKDKEILKGEKGRFLPSVDELENIIEMGQSAYAKGRLDDALKHFSDATEMKPKYDEAWIMKGVILSELQKYELALDAFISALEINIENPKSWFSMGTTLFSLERYEEELECYDKTLELKPDFLPAWNNKGATLLHLERYEKAQQTYDEILKINPDFKLAWNNNGIALKKLKRIEEALECFTNAINIDSRYLDAWLNRGLIYLKEKRYKEAHFCFDAALNIEHENIQTLYQLAKTYEGVGQYTLALEIYDKIIQLDPSFYPAKRRKKKATKYLEQKGDSELDANFFVISEE